MCTNTYDLWFLGKRRALITVNEIFKSYVFKLHTSLSRKLSAVHCLPRGVVTADCCVESALAGQLIEVRSPGTCVCGQNICAQASSVPKIIKLNQTCLKMSNYLNHLKFHHDPNEENPKTIKKTIFFSAFNNKRNNNIKCCHNFKFTAVFKLKLLIHRGQFKEHTTIFEKYTI